MVTFKQLIQETDFRKVWKYINRHYEIEKESYEDDFTILYNKLLELTPGNNSKNMYIYIHAFKNDENDEEYCVESFNEDDLNLYFDVSGKDDEYCMYSLVASKHEDWLSYFIDENTLSKLSFPSIIAHCLWEMTSFGFEQKWDENGSLIIE